MSASALAADCAASSAVFELFADPSPGLLPRLLQPFARRNLVPERFAAHLEGEALKVEIGLSEVSHEGFTLIAGNLRQIVGVRGLRCQRLA